MRRYRYRTAVLIGPWRESHAEAADDAAKAGQVVFEEGGDRFRWAVPGKIEESRPRQRTPRVERV